MKSKELVNFDDFVANRPQKGDKKSLDSKKVKFGDIDDDHEDDWQTAEIKKLNDRLIQMGTEN